MFIVQQEQSMMFFKYKALIYSETCVFETRFMRHYNVSL